MKNTGVRQGIRSKILTSTFAVIVVLTLILILVMTYSMNNLTNDVLRQTLQPMAKTAAQGVEANLHILADRIFMTRDDSVFSDENATTDDKQKVLNKIIAGIEFMWLATYDQNGEISTGSPNAPKSVSGEPYFDLMNTTANLVIADTVLGANGLETIVGTPINDAQGEIAGYLVGSYDYAVIEDSISNINLGAGGTAFIINKDGVYMANRDRNLVETGATITDTYGDGPEIQAMLENMKLGQTGIVTITGIDGIGKDTYFSYSPVSGTLWTLVIKTQKEAYMGSASDAITTSIIVALVLLVIAGLYVGMLAERIQKPIGKATRRINSLAKGDLHTEVEISKGRDETASLTRALSDTVTDINKYTGELSRVLSELSESNLAISVEGEFLGDFVVMKESLNSIVDFLNKIMHSIQIASNQVLSTATLVSANAQQVRDSSGSQSEALSTLRGETEVISANVTGVNDNTAQVANLIDDVMKSLKEGEVHMNNMLNAMSKIDKNSEEITKVNKFLEDISFQTNILALNAAVEASRAGNAGRGFAVVADEVRSLAAKSNESSKKTSEMIEYSRQSINEGSKYAKQMEKSIHDIMETIQEISGITETLKDAVADQTSSLRNVTQQIKEISTLAQQNLNSSRTSADASRELTQQADTLKGMAGKFRLKDEK